MTPNTPADTAERSVRSLLAADATAHALGITVSHVAPGEVTAHMTVAETMLNHHGGAHGSALFALADIAFAMACNSHGHLAIGRSCSIEYLAPAFAGDELVAIAVERALEGRTGIYDVAVRRAGDNALLAELRGHSRTINEPPRPTRTGSERGWGIQH